LLATSAELEELLEGLLDMMDREEIDVEFVVFQKKKCRERESRW